VESELGGATRRARLLGISGRGKAELEILDATYELLGTGFLGPKETRAWMIAAGMTAPQAAGVIHSDFERGFSS